MGKDGFDIVTDLRALINVPAITGMITGSIYPSVRPSGSDKIDIVVNSLGITNTQDQIGFGNINIYVPAIESTVNGKPQSLPDQAKLSSLARAIVPLVDEQYKPTFRCWIEDLPVMLEDADGSYFANIKFRYQSINFNYSNI